MLGNREGGFGAGTLHGGSKFDSLLMETKYYFAQALLTESMGEPEDTSLTQQGQALLYHVRLVHVHFQMPV